MKKTDSQMLILVAIISAVLALVVARLSFGAASKETTIPTVETISSDFPLVGSDSHYKAIFNDQALNPSPPVQLGNGGHQNNQPFGQ